MAEPLREGGRAVTREPPVSRRRCTERRRRTGGAFGIPMRAGTGAVGGAPGTRNAGNGIEP